MTFIERSIQVDAPAAAVWGVFADFAGVAQWHPYMEGAHLDEGSAEHGIGAARICEFGPKMAIRETVRTWDDDGAMTISIDFIRGMAPPIRDIVAGVCVTATGPTSSTLTLTMRYETKLWVLGMLADHFMVVPQYRAVFGHMLAAAKAYAETGAAIEPIAMPGSGRQLAN
ncbi:MAG: SRPBCC family protein [Myxococcota bacterium]